MNNRTVSIKDDWAELLTYLPDGYDTMAKTMKQLEVQYGNAKITTADELLRFLFVHAGAGLPLRQTVAVVEGGGGPSISHVTLHQKMCRAAPYLQSLVNELSSTRRALSVEVKRVRPHHLSQIAPVLESKQPAALCLCSIG